MDGNYSGTSSSLPATVSTTVGYTTPTSRESYGVRFSAALTRRLSANMGFQDSGRGDPGETRFFDMTATYRFNL